MSMAIGFFPSHWPSPYPAQWDRLSAQHTHRHMHKHIRTHTHTQRGGFTLGLNIAPPPYAPSPLECDYLRLLRSGGRSGEVKEERKHGEVRLKGDWVLKCPCERDGERARRKGGCSQCSEAAV